MKSLLQTLTLVGIVTAVAIPAIAQQGARVAPANRHAAQAVYDYAEQNGGVVTCHTQGGNYIHAEITNYSYRQYRLIANVGEAITLSRDGWVTGSSAANADGRLAVWQNNCAPFK